MQPEPQAPREPGHSRHEAPGPFGRRFRLLFIPLLSSEEGGGHRGLTVRPSARATSSSCPLCGVRDGARAHTVSVCESVCESECV